MDNRKLLVVLCVAGIALAAAVVIINPFGQTSRDVSFTILHTNDSHCHYDDDGAAGFPTLTYLRDTYSSDDALFIIDAGDFLQGSSYGIMTLGKASVEVMNTVGYDLTIPGNHEFDYGLDEYMTRSHELNFPTICANLVYKDTKQSVFPEYMVLEKCGVKVGFFGLLTTSVETSTIAGSMGNTETTDPAAAAERMVKVLKDEGVDCIVAVGHLGVDDPDYMTSDEVCNQVSGIDIFIDGHSHTEMEDGKVCDGSIELLPSDTVIASTGCYMKNVGVIKYDNGNISAKLYREKADNKDETYQAIKRVEADVDERLSKQVGKTEIFLNGERDAVRNEETNLGDFMTDAVLRSTDSTICVLNGGLFRTSLEPGDIILKEVYDVFPFLNFVCTVDAPGSAIWDMMDFSLSLMGHSNGGYLQFSGMTVTYDPQADASHRVVSIKVDGKEIDKEATYKVVTIDFIVKGGDGNTFLSSYPSKTVGVIEPMVANYIESMGTITEGDIEGGRLVQV